MELLLQKDFSSYSYKSIIFTFQYGATSTFSLYLKVLQVLVFTFQYGATSTDPRDYTYDDLCNLHSNMELLLLYVYDNFYEASTKFTFQYGATSTQSTLIPKDAKFTFTFQYGATSTDETIKMSAISSSFTFQYGATSTK